MLVEQGRVLHGALLELHVCAGAVDVDEFPNPPAKHSEQRSETTLAHKRTRPRWQVGQGTKLCDGLNQDDASRVAQRGLKLDFSASSSRSAWWL